MRILLIIFTLVVTKASYADSERRNTRLHNSMFSGSSMALVPGENITILEYTLQHTNAAGIDVQTSDGRYPIHVAAMLNSDPEMIRILIKFGAKVNSVDDEGQTPLHFAAMSNLNPDIISVLVDNGAAINLQDMYGNTPLHRIGGPLQSNPLVLERLLLSGASAHIRNQNGDLPIDRIKTNPDIRGTAAYGMLQRAVN
ncbi:MAG: ankyrin repeat domain-containing protein [Sulfitobacter sp.]